MLDEKILYSIMDKAKKYDELIFIHKDNKFLSCSFCGKSQDGVKKIVAGAGAYICNECIELCVEIIKDEIEEDVKTDIEM